MSYNYAGQTKSFVRTFLLSSIDETEYYKCYGILRQNPVGAIEGDCFVKLMEGNYLPSVYTQSQWVLIEDFAKYPMVYTQGKYTAFTFQTYRTGIASFISSDFISWTLAESNSSIEQLSDVTATSDGGYVLTGYSKDPSITESFCFSTDLIHFSNGMNPGKALTIQSLASNGTELLCAVSYDADHVTDKFRFGGNLSYKLNYQTGLHFLNSDTGEVDSSITGKWRNDDSWMYVNGLRLYYNTKDMVEMLYIQRNRKRIRFFLDGGVKALLSGDIR